MKRNGITTPALVYLIIGLLLTTLPLLLNRYFVLPEMLKGFITGLGLALEVIVIAKIQQSRKARKCMASEG